jgi:hypothetical protein
MQMMLQYDLYLFETELLPVALAEFAWKLDTQCLQVNYTEETQPAALWVAAEAPFITQEINLQLE